MTNRIPHIVKTNKGTQQPNNIIWFDTETKHHTAISGKQYHYLWFGWAVHQRRYEGENWSPEDWFRFTTIEQFWDWVLDKTRDKTRLYIFSHNGGFDLPVVDAFLELPYRGYLLHSAIADSPPLVLTWKSGSRTIKFVDTLNFWRMPLAEIGKSIGKSKIAMPTPSASRKKWDEYGKQDVEIIRCIVLSWLTFLRANDLGGFAPTLASQAMNAYRHRFMPIPIYITDRTRALELDRESYLGGRTECFKMGEHKGKYFLLDVNSMYPSVMFTEEYPNKLLGTYNNVTRQELSRWFINKAVVARVIIETDEPVYPIVKDDRLVFPIGTFNATLAGPELEYAHKAGHIKEIGLTNVYEKGPLFREFVAYFYTKRIEARLAGDEVNSWLFKILINSFYGKWGQRGRRFEYDSDCDPSEIDVWEDYDVETDTITRWRSFGGIVQKFINEGESRESFPAIASYVTSFARLKLWQAINKAGRQNCYYCDTDSIVVNQTGLDNLSDLIDEHSLGFWKVEKQLKRLLIHGPKDYEFDEVKKVKGIRKNAKWLTSNVAEQDYFVGLRGLMMKYDLSHPIVFPIQKVNTRNYTKGSINDNFDVLPLVINSTENW